MSSVTAVLGGRRAVVIAVLLLSLLITLQSEFGWGIFVDDPFVSFRYAGNLVEGRGLVFNPGERVEGYTNFLWTVLMALVLRLGWEPVLWSKLLGVAANSGTLLVLFGISFRRRVRLLPAALVPLLLVLDLDFIRWGGGGMETPLFTFLVTAAVAACLGSPGGVWYRWGAPGLAALAALTRPEGVLVATVLAANLLFTREEQGGRRFRDALRFAGLFLLIYGPYFAWRVGYYDSLLPNTFYAKVGGGLRGQLASGAAYFLHHLRSLGGPLYFLLLAVAATRLHRLSVRLSLTLVLAYTGYIVAVGGDWMPSGRFFVPIIPLELLLFSEAMDALWDRRRARSMARVLAIAVALLLTVDPLVPRSDKVSHAIFSAKHYLRTGAMPKAPAKGTGKMSQKVVWRPTDGEEWIARDRALGLWLKEHASPDATIALGAVGVVPYYSKLPAVDFFGLVSSDIARSTPAAGFHLPGHQRVHLDAVLARHPTYIVFSGRSLEESGATTPFRARQLGFAAHPLFQECYEPLPLQVESYRYTVYQCICAGLGEQVYLR